MITINDIDTRLCGRKHIVGTGIESLEYPEDVFHIGFDNGKWAECSLDTTDRSVLLITIYETGSDGCGEYVNDGWHDFSGETDEQCIENLYVELLDLAGIK